MARGPKMPGNMGNMMKKVQKMQKDMEKMQKEIEKKEFTGTAGGGAVSVTVNGKKEMLKVELDEAVIDPEDKEMLQDIIVAAANQAMEKAADEMEQSMGKLTGGMNIPGMF